MRTIYTFIGKAQNFSVYILTHLEAFKPNRHNRLRIFNETPPGVRYYQMDATLTDATF
jgi:hypothetical protein